MRPLLVTLVLALAACNSSDDVALPGGGPGGGGAPTFADARLAECAMNSPYLDVGRGIDAPGTLEIPVTPGPQPAGPCRGSAQFRFGSGLYDITGPVANTGGMGWEDPEQVFSGLHQRQYARAFAIESPCNGKRVLFVSTDTGMIFGSVRLGVLDAIAADAELSAHYAPDNVMLSATHTHSGPAGFAHYDAFNTFHFGFDALVLDTIVAGILEAIRLAHANLQAHPQPASIRLAVGELLDTNINRSFEAFAQNLEDERRAFLDARGEPVNVDKRFVQLNLVRDNGSAAGVINWFGVHPTVIGSMHRFVSSDIKGFASQGFEKVMGTRYDAPAGPDNFVAGFAQTDEGDSSPNIFILERPHPDPTRGGGADDFESNAISGAKQLAKSLELFTRGAPLSGPVDYRFFHVRMDQVEVTDPVVLASLRHPPELDADPKRTCVAALGVSFGAGAEDGPGPTVEGVDCSDDPDFIAAAQADFEAAAAGKIPPHFFAAAVGCNHDEQPAIDLACHAEKPVLFVVGPPLDAEPSVVPMQLFRIGNLALIGLSWEVTTMSARRIRGMLLDVLAPVGVDTVVVAGLSNDYSHYLSTREEYGIQHYEGASTIFGPWSLAAVQQETRKLALAMRDGEAAPDGPDYAAATPGNRRPPYNPSDTPGEGGGFGTLVTDVPPTAARGETVRAEVQGGHPRNDLRIQSSYVFAERQLADGSWQVVATDRDPELFFAWNAQSPSPLPVDPPTIGPSTSEAIWTLPLDLPAGTYRLRIEGAAQTGPLLPPEPYSTPSSPFVVSGDPGDCPL